MHPDSMHAAEASRWDSQEWLSYKFGTASSTTECSGLIRNVQMRAPLRSTPAVTKNGVIQNPRCAKKPKTTGDTDAASAPAVFITLLTVPLNSPPTSMGTAQAGPITSSRKKNEMARQVTAVHPL